MMRRVFTTGFCWGFICVVLLCCSALAQAVTLETIISREHPQFTCATANLMMGRDGKIYISSGGDKGFAIRMDRDGKNQDGTLSGGAFGVMTANREGIMAASHGHFSHAVTIHNRAFQQIAIDNEFWNGDTRWGAPSSVAAGETDFYGVDCYRNRIIRITPKGKPVHYYNVPPLSKNESLLDVRVNEAKQYLYVLTYDQTLRCLTFDGTERWKLKGVNARQFDVDAAGTLYYFNNALGARQLQVIGDDGKPQRKLNLQVPEDRQPDQKAQYRSLCVWEDELFIRRTSETELFQVYSLTDGRFLRAVDIRHERMTAEFPDYVLPTGGKTPLRIACQVGAKELVRAWRVELAPYGTNWWRRLAWDGQELTLPADAEGLYVLRITGPSSEYLLREVVTVRKPDARGTLSVWTPLGRVGYARGEKITALLSLRSVATPRAEVKVGLYPEKSTTAVWTMQGDAAATGQDLPLTVPATVTTMVAPGHYYLRVAGDGLSAAAQPVEIGIGRTADPVFINVAYGDYGDIFPHPNVNAWESIAPIGDPVAQRLSALGFNMSVARLGDITVLNDLKWRREVDVNFFQPLTKRLGGDALGVDPRRAEIGTPRVQAMGAQSALGLKEMAIVNYMDAGLPMWKGVGNDGRTQAQYADAIKTVNQTLLPFSSFRGWAWIANWWEYTDNAGVVRKDGKDLRFTSNEEREKYAAASQRMKETGAWDPIFDQVDGRFYAWPAEAIDFCKKTSEAALAESPWARKLVNANSGPVRRPHTYPPIYFSNVDEVDLHFQAEQIGTPMWTGFAVDYYRRPDKPSWIHPEIQNDQGDGLQMLPLTWLAVMRGVDGIGTSGNVPHWRRAMFPLDGRGCAYGMTSVYRALNQVLQGYGPWLRQLKGADRIAIVACPRMSLEDTFAKDGLGRYYARLFAAYLACHLAKQPATVVYPEDINADTLVRRFKAVLVVSQQVEMEPQMAALLQTAQARGVKVFADASCRPTCVKGFTPLPVGFDTFENIPVFNSDYAYWEVPEYFNKMAPAMATALANSVEPVAKVDQPWVMVSERSTGALRVFFAVDVAQPPLEPTQLLRVRPAISTTYPLTAKITLPATGAVYDVLDRRLLANGQQIQADLRYNAGRMYAVLPTPIEAVVLTAADRVPIGQSLPVTVRVVSTAGRAIDAPLPVMLRLRDGAGALLEEMPLAVPTAGARATFTAPANAPGPLKLEAIDLIAGKTASRTVVMPTAPAAAAPAGAPAFDWEAQPAARYFGPRLRDIVVSQDGKTALCNAFEWGNNLFTLDITTGNVLGAHRIGQHHAFNPVATPTGFAVQGEDLDAPSLYHLYQLDGTGKAVRRFALPGIPGRKSIWQVAGMLQDRINNFALPASGKWIAACGNQALAVWTADGTLRWAHDWSREDRHTLQLRAVGDEALLTTNDITATLLDAATGTERWRLQLATSGKIEQTVVTPDGRTIALLATTELGPKVFVLREGKVIASLPTGGDELLLAPDGERVILLDDTKLKCYALTGDPLWMVTSQQPLYQARFSTDGARVAVCDDLGLLHVYDREGEECFSRDLGAYAITAWLPNGDLLAATWMGTVYRLSPEGTIGWRTMVDAATMPEEKVPTVAITPAAVQPATAAPSPNLLTPTGTMIIAQFVSNRNMQATGSTVRPLALTQSTRLLLDGQTTPPAIPWLNGDDLSRIESGWVGEVVLTIDNVQQLLRVDEVEFVEDPAHPESWIRDVRLEYFDLAAEQWKFAGYLCADAADHVHKLATPIVASRFRLLKSDGRAWPVGNLRLAELIFRGQALGSPHPDVVAGKPVATLFDDGDSIFNDAYFSNLNSNLALRAGTPEEPASSGSFYLQMKAPGTYGAKYSFVSGGGSLVPSWGIPVAEQPAPGQYRYLRIAWRALADATTGITVGITDRDPRDGGYLYVGKLADGVNPARAKKLADTPSMGWQIVTVDLWELLGKKPFQVSNLVIGCQGGPAAVDSIQLARTEADFAH